MSDSPVLNALLRLWPQLPALAGTDWANLYWKLRELLLQWEAAEDEAEKARLALELRDSLRTLPGWKEALREAQARITRQERGGPGEALTPSAETETLPSLKEILHPAVVELYTDVYCPSRVLTSQRFPIIVGLTRAPADPDLSQEVKAIQAQLNQLIKVVLITEPDALLSEPVQSLPVTEKDTPPAVFYLRFSEDGSRDVILDFYQQSDLLISQKLHVEIVSAAEKLAAPPLPPQLMRLDDYRAPFPDVVLRVTTQDGRFHYIIHPENTGERRIDGEKLHSDPELYRYRVLQEIENLAKGQDADGKSLVENSMETLAPQDFFRRLEKIGQRLFQELFNEELRAEYRRWRQEGVRSLEIVSDEPWIPWELVKPFDDDYDDAFLCLQYDFSRWVSGAEPPAAQIGLDTLACIAPTDSGLLEAQEEKRWLCEQAAQRGLRDRSPANPTRREVESLLDGSEPVHWWHFACHGNYDAQHPGNSPLTMQGGWNLHPNDLVGAAQRRLRRDRPFVFLNACRAGEGGLGLTGMGGWAKVLVQDCRVGALLAPLWKVNDRIACEFAQAFYRALAEVPYITLAQAVRKARLEIKERYPYATEWLAYSLYGHPNARVYYPPPPDA